MRFFSLLKLVVATTAITLTIAACSTIETPDLGSFDSEAFKKDHLGCAGIRSAQIDSLKSLEPKILGLSERQITMGFGRYDYQILDRRSEKIWVYFLEKGPQCNELRQPSDALVMELHMNAVGLVKEVEFRRGNPAE